MYIRSDVSAYPAECMRWPPVRVFVSNPGADDSDDTENEEVHIASQREYLCRTERCYALHGREVTDV